MRKSGWFVGAAAIGLVGALSVVSESACTVAGTCDRSYSSYCDPSSADCRAPFVTPFQGHLVDPYTWESVPLGCTANDGPACAGGGAWIDYPGERGYFVQLADAVTHEQIRGRIYEVNATIATSSHPEKESFTIAGGNLAIWTVPFGADKPWVYVQNDTCAFYTLRLTVHAEPSADASVDATKD